MSGQTCRRVNDITQTLDLVDGIPPAGPFLPLVCSLIRWRRLKKTAS
ncbi:hypothetical protein [Streptomyces sp. NPDC048309]